MEKLFAGAAVVAVLAAAIPAWADAPDAPQTFEQPGQAVTARAHLIFTTAIDPPLVGDVTVIQQGPDIAVVKASFTQGAPTKDMRDATPCPPAASRPAAPAKTQG